jgi:hypothetical protein
VRLEGVRSLLLAHRCNMLRSVNVWTDAHLTGIHLGSLTEQMQLRAASASTSARGYPPEPLGYSMTSSARARSVGGTSSPRAFAVFKVDHQLVAGRRGRRSWQ